MAKVNLIEAVGGVNINSVNEIVKLKDNITNDLTGVKEEIKVEENILVDKFSADLEVYIGNWITPPLK